MTRAKTSRRTAAGIAAVSAAVLLLTGCGSNSGSNTATAAETELEQTTVKFGILPTPDYAPIQIASEEGFFNEEGLDVTTVVMSPGGAIPAVLGGSLDVVGANWISVIQATDKGVGIAPIAESDRGTPGYAETMVRKDSPIKTLTDLDGKKVGVVATPGNCDLIPLDKLKRAGSTAEPNFVNIAIPDMPGNIQRGGIDAACVPEPTLSAMKATGDFRSIDDLFSGDYDRFPVIGFVTSEEYAEANPNTVAAVQRALQKAKDLARSNPDIVRQAVPEYTSIPAEAAETMTLPYYPEEGDFSALQIVVDVLKNTGLVPDATLPDKGN